MRLVDRAPIGLLGRIFAILLLTFAIEFSVNTFLYERASETSVREDESRRLAEHLIIARKLLAEAPLHERPALSTQLTTDRYIVHWSPTAPATPPVPLALDEMRRQVLAWEPDLASTGLTLRLHGSGRNSTAVGALRLPDATWLSFATVARLHTWDIALGRIILALVPAIAMIVVAGLLLRRTLQPLRGLARAADRLGNGAAVEEVPEGGSSDVRQLVRAFNAMQTRIHRLIAERTEALAAVGDDLKTPLARLALQAEAVDGDLGRTLRRDIAEMTAMLSSVLDYLGGEADPERPARGDLAVLLATLADDAEDRGFPSCYTGPEHCELDYRQLGIKRALTNLVDNALHYAGNVELFLERQDDCVTITVADRGPGIPPEHVVEVMRPFSRLDPARARNTGGLGLGLAIVGRAVETERGRFTLSPRDGGGLEAVIVLPSR